MGKCCARRAAAPRSLGSEQGLGEAPQRGLVGRPPVESGATLTPSFHSKGYGVMLRCLPSSAALCTGRNPPGTEGRPRRPQAFQGSSGCNGEHSGSAHGLARGRVSPLAPSRAFSTLPPLLMRGGFSCVKPGQLQCLSARGKQKLVIKRRARPVRLGLSIEHTRSTNASSQTGRRGLKPCYCSL